MWVCKSLLAAARGRRVYTRIWVPIDGSEAPAQALVLVEPGALMGSDTSDAEYVMRRTSPVPVLSACNPAPAAQEAT
jgi:hypothetical protein